MICLLWVIVFALVIGALLFNRVNMLFSLLATAVLLVLFDVLGSHSMTTMVVLWIIWLLFLPLGLPALRKQLISKKLFKLYKKTMPKMSSTEKEALEAGTVWFDRELFSGRPKWSVLFDYDKPKLSAEEQAFMDGPVEELCSMINDWEITHKDGDLPEKVWQFLKDNGFFALIIPKSYGGKEFSALAHASILVKVFTTGITIGSTVAVPNSLGPAELLLHYGTEEQKNHYLPRLADGRDIPCFALTAPHAGSDAASLTDSGVVCKGMHEGVEVIGLRLNWNKRYITLAPVATVLGLAFKMYDPEHLLGDVEDLGITCALIPTDTAGVTIGRRHIPGGAVFQNGPTQGKDVFVPLDYIIGGAKMAGQGWRMLMECLSVGRSISLPSSGVAGGQFFTYMTGAYARVRRQFNMPIGCFEGIEEVIARMAGHSYQATAMGQLTVQAIDNGEKPAVLSGILKYHCTEIGRASVNDAMDIHGGKAVCLGQGNYLAPSYQGSPVGITVEGANILTRNMIIFGQGAIRCHPYVLKELQAAQADDLHAFDKNFFAHIGFTFSNMLRSFVLGLTHSSITCVPNNKMKKVLKHLTRFSSSFALLSDVTMATLGGELKRRERISARLGDILSYLYIASAVIKFYQNDDCPKEDLPVVQWACEDLLFKIQTAFDELLSNYPNKALGMFLRVLIFPIGKRFKKPSDKLGHKVSALMINETETRERLARGIYQGEEGFNCAALLKKAMTAAIAIEPIEKAVRYAQRKGKITGRDMNELMQAAVAAEIISAEDLQQWKETCELRDQVINVDDFDTNDVCRH
jgi:acyl-CoA dehydrogenase